MYSQAELSAIIKEVFLEDVASGQIDLPALISESFEEIDWSNLDFTAKTLEQVNPNYSLDLSEAFEDGNYSTYFKSNTGYLAFKVINGVLWIIMSGVFVAQAWTGTNSQFQFVIPAEFKSKYYSKIFRMDGTPLNQSYDSATEVCLFPATIQVGGSIYTRNAVLRSSGSANGDLEVGIYNYGNTTEDTNIRIDIRLPLTII